MTIKHSAPAKSIESIDFIAGINGESGWMISLKDGYSFDPMANDVTRFIPSDCLHEALELVVYNI
jgi:hypothetical protein